MFCSAFIFNTGNSALDEDDATLLSEGKNLNNELQISSIRLDYTWCFPMNLTNTSVFCIR